MGVEDATLEHKENLQHVSGRSGDIATTLVGEDGCNVLITPEMNRKCLRRIDFLLMPVMFISFGLQYMDKTCLTGAALFGIIQDLDLYSIETFGSSNQPVLSLRRYSYASMIFYWGYMLGVIPGALLSQRLPVGKFVGIAIIIWGGVSICTIAVKSYEGLLVQRFFLGVAEAGISPAFSLITAMWYKRHEQPLRFSIWYSSTGFGALVGTLIIYGIGHIHGSLAAWQYQFMILGAVTCLWGFIVLAVLPDNPVQACPMT